MVYDVSNRTTFDNAQEHWLCELRAQADPSSSLMSCVMLVGNKVDLDPSFPDGALNDKEEDDDAVPGFVYRALHERAAAQLGVMEQRASAKTGANVCAAFEQLIVAIYDHNMAQRERLKAQNRRTEPLDSFHLDEESEASRKHKKKKKSVKGSCCDQ